MDIKKLKDYQWRAIDYMLRRPRCALWIDMGLGKTVITLTAVKRLIDAYEVDKVLVVAPLRVAKHTWPQEINNWQHLSDITYSVVCGTRCQRVNALLNKADIYIVNREMLSWLVDYHGVSYWPYDMVIIDEASGFKNPRSVRYKSLRKVLPRTQRLVELTGTPAGNGLLDLWSQIYLLDRGERLGRTYTTYLYKYFACQDRMGYTWTPKHGAADQIQQELADICLTLSARDYLAMPDKVDNVIRLEMGDHDTRRYSELERNYMLSVDNGAITAYNAAALSNKLLQYANGAVYTADGDWEVMHSYKLDALGDIIEEAAGQPVLVAYNYRSDLARIKERYPHAVAIDDGPDVIANWSAGRVQLLLAHPASAGHGLNLQHGGNIAVWYGLNWSLELYQQFNARLHRQGQSRPVIIHHLVMSNTIDDTVMRALSSKHATQQALLDGLNRDIKRRLALEANSTFNRGSVSAGTDCVSGSLDDPVTIDSVPVA
jgi:SNF2 family DNA or RNA helicase